MPVLTYKPYLVQVYFITRKGQGKLAIQLLWKKKKVQKNSSRVVGDKISSHYYEKMTKYLASTENTLSSVGQRKTEDLKYLPHFSISLGPNYTHLISLKTPKKTLNGKPFKSDSKQ
jgi:hypothetical protein